jgi:hypothetical protein
MNLVKNYELDNLAEIQSELLDYLNNNTKNIYINSQLRFSYIAVPSDHILNLPCLNETLRKIFAVQPSYFKFYNMQPGSHLKPHMDGIFNDPIGNFGFNIPVYNCESVETIFYNCDETNIKSLNLQSARLRLPINESKLTEIKRYIINRPSFISTNIMHSVENNTANNRIMFLMRWLGVKSYKEVLKL